MRSVRSLLAVATTIFAFGLIAQTASADDKMKPLSISKECSQYSGNTPSFCTIVESSLGAIKPGTKVLYYGPVTNNPAFSSNNVVLDDGAGSTAMGNCIVDFGADRIRCCVRAHGAGCRIAGYVDLERAHRGPARSDCINSSKRFGETRPCNSSSIMSAGPRAQLPRQ